MLNLDLLMNITFTVQRLPANLEYKGKGASVGLIESEYLKRVDALSPKERVARAASMFQWAREIMARQILSDLGPMSPERLKWMVAMRQYGADETTRELIQRALANVPH